MTDKLCHIVQLDTSMAFTNAFLMQKVLGRQVLLMQILYDSLKQLSTCASMGQQLPTDTSDRQVQQGKVETSICSRLSMALRKYLKSWLLIFFSYTRGCKRL